MSRVGSAQQVTAVFEPSALENVDWNDWIHITAAAHS